MNDRPDPTDLTDHPDTAMAPAVPRRMAYSPAEAAILLGLSRPSIDNLIRTGALKAVNVKPESERAYWRIGHNEILKFLEGTATNDD